VKTVSEQAGFQDYSYFYRAFRKKVGMTPKEYRRQAGSI
jgi:AraC-like DNA-binding protein